MRKTVLSLTPTSIESDMRTWKLAKSFARLGFRSIIFEGIPSRMRSLFDLPVFSWTPVFPSLTSPNRVEPDMKGPLKKLAKNGGHFPHGAGFSLGNLALSLAYRMRFQWRNNLKLLSCLPLADFYYLHGFDYGPAVLRACRSRGNFFIYDAHDCYWELRSLNAKSPFRRNWIEPYLNAVERKLMNEAIEVVTVSDGIAAKMEKQFFRRPIVLSNAHDVRIETAVGRDIRAAVGIGPDDFLIVSIGNEKPGQAIVDVLAALAALPDNCHLAFLGKDYGRYEAIVRSLGLGHRVHFPGAVPAPSIVPFVRTADAGLLPYYALADNWKYALPNGFFQVLAAGLPLLYPADLVEICAIAYRHRLGLPIRSRDSASIVAAVSCLISDPDFRSRQGKASLAAAEVLSWEAEEKKLAALLDRTLLKCPSP